MAQDQELATGTRKGLVLLEVVLSVLVFAILSAGFLWNWDGFWQTKIPLLVNGQKTYFPAKYQEEQSKLSNMDMSTQKWGEALNRIAELESENLKLRQELEREAGAKQ